MAANIFDVPASAVACVAATAKTVLGVRAATNVRLKVTELSSSFDGATSTATPALVEANTCTFGANAPGTNSTSVTPVKRDAGADETIQGTAAKNWTTEPTTQTQARPIYEGQYNGTVVLMYPFSAPHIVVGGAGLVIRVTPSATVNWSGHIAAEE